MKRILTLTLLASGLFAAELPPIPAGALGKAEARPAARAAAAAKASPDAVNFTLSLPGVIQDTIINDNARQTVAPNGYILVDSKADYTGADRVAIALNSDADARNLQVVAAWAAPGNYYAVTDMTVPGNWASPYAVGLNIPVYASELKIGIFNSGTVPIEVKQLTVYAVIHP